MEFNATFITAIVSFIVFAIIMNQILYKPVENIANKRKNLIDENYDIAQQNSQKKEAILQDRLDKLNNARNAAKEEFSAALDQAKKERNQLEIEAKEKAAGKIENDINILNDNKKEAIEALKKDVINLAQIISDKFIDAPEKITNIADETIEKIMQE